MPLSRYATYATTVLNQRNDSGIFPKSRCFLWVCGKVPSASFFVIVIIFVNQRCIQGNAVFCKFKCVAAVSRITLFCDDNSSEKGNKLFFPDLIFMPDISGFDTKY